MSYAFSFVVIIKFGKSLRKQYNSLFIRGDHALSEKNDSHVIKGKI